MKKSLVWTVSDWKERGIQTFSYLLGLTVYLTVGITSVYAEQTFAGPGAHEDPYTCSSIQWLQKDHKYEGFRHKAIHNYHFRGRWAQQACDASDEGKDCFFQYWDIEASGIYREETDRFTENVTFMGKKPMKGGGYISVEAKFLTEGKSTTDPWIFPTFAVTDFTSKCTMNRVTNPNGASLDYGNPSYFETPPIFFTRCAFSAAERGALGKEEPVLLTCTNAQIQAKPKVVAPTPNQFFSDYKDAYAALEMPCLPPMPQSTLNGFNYILEEKIVENNGSEYWVPLCNPCSIKMDPSEYHYLSKGLKKLNLERSGYYRIKFNQQVQTEANLIAGKYTDWISFSARPVVSGQAGMVQKEKINIPGGTGIQPITPAAVIVNTMRIKPQQPKAGQVFEIYIDFFNKGNGSTGVDQKYYATCTPQNGGAPVWNPGPHPVNQIIKPNQSVQVIFKGSIKNPGTYVLAVKPEPMASDVTFAKLLTFSVGPLMSVKPRTDVMQKQ